MKEKSEWGVLFFLSPSSEKNSLLLFRLSAQRYLKGKSTIKGREGKYSSAFAAPMTTVAL